MFCQRRPVAAEVVEPSVEMVVAQDLTDLDLEQALAQAKAGSLLERAESPGV